MADTRNAAGSWVEDLHARARAWLEHPAHVSPHASAQTPAYVDLLFSFGLAMRGETVASVALQDQARRVLEGLDDAHQWLLAAFSYRIEEARAGEPHAGPLPRPLLTEAERMERLQRWVVDTLRKHSRVLEPDQKIDPYRHWGAKISELEKALAELTDLTEGRQISQRVDALLAALPEGRRGERQRFRVLWTAMGCAPRVNEEFGRRMLEQAVPAYDALPDPADFPALMERAAFLEKGLFLAAYFGLVEQIPQFIARFEGMLDTRSGEQAVQALDTLAGQCLRSLRKLGMHDEIDRLLGQMVERILDGEDIRSVDFARPPGPDTLRALLHVAAGWYSFGRDEQAAPAMEKARELLYSVRLPAREQTKLAVGYVATLGAAPEAEQQARLVEVFERLHGIKDTYTTSSHFSVAQLDVAEAVVWAVVTQGADLPLVVGGYGED